jgi:hypothetical protein
MPSKSETLQALKAELESVNATIEKYSKVRSALIEVIKFLGNEQLQDLLSHSEETAPEALEDDSTAEGDGSQTTQESLPALPQDGIEAVRKALAARNQM